MWRLLHDGNKLAIEHKLVTVFTRIGCRTQRLILKYSAEILFLFALLRLDAEDGNILSNIHKAFENDAIIYFIKVQLYISLMYVRFTYIIKAWSFARFASVLFPARTTQLETKYDSFLCALLSSIYNNRLKQKNTLSYLSVLV